MSTQEKGRGTPCHGIPLLRPLSLDPRLTDPACQLAAQMLRRAGLATAYLLGAYALFWAGAQSSPRIAEWLFVSYVMLGGTFAVIWGGWFFGRRRINRPFPWAAAKDI